MKTGAPPPLPPNPSPGVPEVWVAVACSVTVQETPIESRVPDGIELIYIGREIMRKARLKAVERERGKIVSGRNRGRE